MVQAAQREPIADDWLAFRFCVWDDVGSVQELVVTEPAEGALMLIRGDHAFPKCPLMQAPARSAVCVSTPPGGSAPRVH